MLEFSFLHKDNCIKELQNIYVKNRDEFVQFTCENYFDLKGIDNFFPNSDWENLSLASVDKNREVIGIIKFSFDRIIKDSNMSLISFKRDLKSKRIFYRDIIESFNKIFNDYEVNTIRFSAIGFNKNALKIYFKLAKEKRCRYVGFKSNFFCYKRKFYNSFMFEMQKKHFERWRK